eukprot:3447646-Amphidinium_carterae.4
MAVHSTSKSISQIVGTTLDNNDWWKNLMAEFLAKAASTMQKREAYIEMQQELQEMETVNEQCTGSLVHMLQQVPQLMTISRQGALGRFLQSVELKLTKMWDFISSKPHDAWDPAEIKAFLTLFTEASSVWPLQVKYHDYLEQLGAMRDDCVLLEVFVAIHKSSLALNDIKLEDHTQFEEQVEKLLQSLNTASQPKLIKKEWETAWGKTIETIFDFMEQWWKGPTDRLALMSSCAVCAHELSMVLQNKAAMIGCKYVRDCIEWALAFEAMQKDGDKATLKAIINLKRKLAASILPSVENALLAHNLCKKTVSYKKTVVEIQSIKQQTLLDEAKSDLKKNISVLQALQHGMQDGTSWLQNFAGADFDELLKHASETILANNGEDLDSAVNNLEEACLLSCPCFESVGLVPDCQSKQFASLVDAVNALVGERKRGELHGNTCYKSCLKADRYYKVVVSSLEAKGDKEIEQSAQKVALEANKIKSTCAFLRLFQDIEDPGTLRSKVQTETKTLRAQGLNEATALHPLLSQKVLNTLRFGNMVVHLPAVKQWHGIDGCKLMLLDTNTMSCTRKQTKSRIVGEELFQVTMG